VRGVVWRRRRTSIAVVVGETASNEKQKQQKPR
jgi:hypothetical protein